MIARAISVVLALALGGCITTSQSTRTTTPVCDALVGPIKYNSTVKTSRRFAGPDLAPDLVVRNRVGMNLRCPKYK